MHSHKMQIDTHTFGNTRTPCKQTKDRSNSIYEKRAFDEVEVGKETLESQGRRQRTGCFQLSFG